MTYSTCSRGSDWELYVAAGGTLTRWRRELLAASSQQNNVWCRRGPSQPWALDVTIGDGSDTEWIFRRNPTVRAPWDVAVLRTAGGVPYLAPELQLLFKSKHVRAKDDVDARIAIPELTPQRRSWLRQLLPDGHPWNRYTT